MRTPSFNVVQFVESPLGLSFSKNLGEHGLFPVQKFVLKMMFGVPLSDEPDAIDIPTSWKYVDSDKRWNRLKFSEAEYLEYLIDRDRAFPSTEPGRPKNISLAFGRRSGTSSLLSFAGLYDIYTLLESPDPWEGASLPKGSMMQVTLMAHNRDMSSILCSESRKTIRSSWFLNDRLSMQTNSSLYFKRPFDEDKKETIRMMFYSFGSKGIRGTSSKSIYVDCACQVDTQTLQALMPSLYPYNGSFVLAATPTPDENAYCKMYWKNAEDAEGLALSIPSWEMNPTIPQKFFGDSHRRFNQESFDHEYGAKVPILTEGG